MIHELEAKSAGEGPRISFWKSADCMAVHGGCWSCPEYVQCWKTAKAGIQHRIATIWKNRKPNGK